MMMMITCVNDTHDRLDTHAEEVGKRLTYLNSMMSLPTFVRPEQGFARYTVPKLTMLRLVVAAENMTLPSQPRGSKCLT